MHFPLKFFAKSYTYSREGKIDVALFYFPLNFTVLPISLFSLFHSPLYFFFPTFRFKRKLRVHLSIRMHISAAFSFSAKGYAYSMSLCFSLFPFLPYFILPLFQAPLYFTLLSIFVSLFLFHFPLYFTFLSLFHSSLSSLYSTLISMSV